MILTKKDINLLNELAYVANKAKKDDENYFCLTDSSIKLNNVAMVFVTPSDKNLISCKVDMNIFIQALKKFKDYKTLTIEQENLSLKITDEFNVIDLSIFLLDYGRNNNSDNLNSFYNVLESVCISNFNNKKEQSSILKNANAFITKDKNRLNLRGIKYVIDSDVCTVQTSDGKGLYSYSYPIYSCCSIEGIKKATFYSSEYTSKLFELSEKQSKCNNYSTLAVYNNDVFIVGSDSIINASYYNNTYIANHPIDFYKVINMNSKNKNSFVTDNKNYKEVCKGFNKRKFNDKSKTYLDFKDKKLTISEGTDDSTSFLCNYTNKLEGARIIIDTEKLLKILNCFSDNKESLELMVSDVIYTDAKGINIATLGFTLNKTCIINTVDFLRM